MVWREIGSRHGTGQFARKRIMFSNQVAMVFLVVSVMIFLLNWWFVGSFNLGIKFVFLGLMSLVMLMLNARGFNGVVQHMIVGLPWLVLFVSPFILGDHLAEHDMVWYPYLAVATSILPIIIYDIRLNPVALIFWVLLYFITVLGIDELVAKVADVEETAMYNQYYALFNITQIGSYVFLNLTFFYQSQTTRKFERQLSENRDQLQEDAELLKEQAQRIRTQRDELVTKNEAIERLNRNLEEIVKERTAQLEKQNAQLRDYASFNAHQVRGPLSRLLGLTNMFKGGMVDEAQQAFFLNKIDESAREVDAVIHEINDILHQDEDQKPIGL